MQVAPYYDSNAKEQIIPERSGGLRMRIDFDETVWSKAFRFDGSLMTHGYADAILPQESKIVVTPSLKVTTELWTGTVASTSISHLEKRYYHQVKKVRWTEFNAMIQQKFSPKFSGWVDVNSRTTSARFGQVYRYNGVEFQAGGKYSFSKQLNADIILTGIRLIHRDFSAWDFQNGSNLIRLNENQKDLGSRLTIHVQYRRNLITGIQTTLEKIQSNSILGDYYQVAIRGYLTGHIGEATFYHFVVQYTQKNYRKTVQSVPRVYLDPERPAQNRAYFRIERIFDEHIISYGQVSSLQNETVRINRYYDKALIELGIIYQW